MADALSLFPLSAFLVGIWSSAHCLAMCGGLAAAAGHRSRISPIRSKAERGLELFAWQWGRITSYAFMGGGIAPPGWPDHQSDHNQANNDQ
ncbi:MAG: sulfite exporter TauE/SafE family protein [Betaproteobacteria bacterium]|nr:sulfite exporter TauE/SafE family protein [Betaproteobacteria bacterium]